MDLDELLHPLSTLLTGVVFASCLVFSLSGTLQGAGRDQPKIWNPFCSTPWTGECLTSLHTVILWRTMRCPMILSLIGQPSARASGVCLLREKKKSLWICGNSPETCKQASWPFHRWSVDHGWVSTGRLAFVCWVQWKYSVGQCWEFIVCTTDLWEVIKVVLIEPSELKCTVPNNVFQYCSWQRWQWHRPELSAVHRPLFGSGGCKRNARWAHSLWPKMT